MKRREFLQLAAGGAASLAAGSRGVFAAATDEPLRVGLIGCGWYGKTDLFHLIQVAPVEVVGLCDVDRLKREEAAEWVSQRQPSQNQPATFGDYRTLLSEQRPEIVLVGTPDHWHCLPTVAACQAGADVYVQKPISWDVAEGQAMVAAAEKYGRTVQVGFQRRSTPHLLEARDRFLTTRPTSGWLASTAVNGNAPGPTGSDESHATEVFFHGRAAKRQARPWRPVPPLKTACCSTLPRRNQNSGRSCASSSSFHFGD